MQKIRLVARRGRHRLLPTLFFIPIVGGNLKTTVHQSKNNVELPKTTFFPIGKFISLTILVDEAKL